MLIESDKKVSVILTEVAEVCRYEYHIIYIIISLGQDNNNNNNDNDLRIQERICEDNNIAV